MKYNLKKNKKKNLPVIFDKRNFPWFLSFLLLSLHVFLAVQTSSLGARIALYEQEIGELESENEKLSVKLIDSTSLTKLNKISEEMGFGKIDKTLYLQPGDSFAEAR